MKVGKMEIFKFKKITMGSKMLKVEIHSRGKEVYGVNLSKSNFDKVNFLDNHSENYYRIENLTHPKKHLIHYYRITNF